MMMLALSLLVLQAGSGAAPFSHSAAASQDSTSHKAVCDNRSVSVSYSNSAKRQGAVDSLQIDGREVPGAIATLNQVLGKRDIEQIAFMACRGSGGTFRVDGVMRAGMSASVRTGAKEANYFSIGSSSIEMEEN